jgi:hypothetical protein
MNWKNTWILVGVAAALFAFIFLYERRLNPSGIPKPLPTLFSGFKPSTATSIQLRRGNQFALVLDRTNGTWHFSKPVAYPAAGFAVEKFLEGLERLIPATHLSASEIRARKQTSADFGFDSPPVVIALERGDQRRELRFGARTPAGDQVYVEVVGQPGYSVVAADILDRLPRTQYDWRDTALFHLGEEPVDRLEVARPGAGFVLDLDPTNRLWRLTRTSHRADQIQVRQLLDKIQAARAIEFVTDDARADVEPFGLQAPEFEVTLASGPTAQKVQFGRSPTNDPTRVYARIVSHMNVVLAPRGIIELLSTPYAELRDRQLVAFAPELIDAVEVRGIETFVARRNSNGTWMAGDIPADPLFVAQWLTLMSQLQAAEFVKDVVTDFTPYGLAPPQQEYVLRTTVTNAAGTTNAIVAQLQFGTNGTNDRVFARRADEDSVYSIRRQEYTYMPATAWQFREQRIWRFTTNQVAKISVQQDGETREVLRQPDGDWVRVKGVAEVNPFAFEELALRLGELSAVMWLGRGEEARARFGFTTNAPRLSVELRGEKPQTLTIEFGGRSPLLRPYALAMVDGQPTVFEFPWPLYDDLQRYFNLVPTDLNRRLPNLRPAGK